MFAVNDANWPSSLLSFRLDKGKIPFIPWTLAKFKVIQMMILTRSGPSIDIVNVSQSFIYFSCCMFFLLFVYYDEFCMNNELINWEQIGNCLLLWLLLQFFGCSLGSFLCCCLLLKLVWVQLSHWMWCLFPLWIKLSFCWSFLLVLFNNEHWQISSICLRDRSSASLSPLHNSTVCVSW